MSDEESDFWTLVDKLFREMTPGVYEQAYAEGLELGKREVLAKHISIRLTRHFGELPADITSALAQAPSNTLGNLLAELTPECTLPQIRAGLRLGVQ